MSDWKDYYDILGVDPEASNEEIKEAYQFKCQTIHPDKVPDKYKFRATEELKAVNEAYQVLKDPQQRQRYHSKWLNRQRGATASSKKSKGTTGRRHSRDRTAQTSSPRPDVDRSIIRFNDVTPGEIQTASFIVRNLGGPCKTEPWVDSRGSWVKVPDVRPLNSFDRFPAEVEVEAVGEDWDEDYFGEIIVGLDNQEIPVKVELHTKPQPETETTSTAPSAGYQAIFPFTSSWGWELAGLIGSMAVAVFLIVYGAMEPQVSPILLGCGLSALSTYSAVKTNWLKETRGISRPVKVGAGASIVCGWIPPIAILAYFALIIIMAMLILGLFCWLVAVGLKSA